MTHGERLREPRQAKQFTLRVLAAKVGVGFTYRSKIENHKLKKGHSPSENLIRTLATELDADEEELFLLAEKGYWADLQTGLRATGSVSATCVAR